MEWVYTFCFFLGVLYVVASLLLGGIMEHGHGDAGTGADMVGAEAGVHVDAGVGADAHGLEVGGDAAGVDHGGGHVDGADAGHAGAVTVLHFLPLSPLSLSVTSTFFGGMGWLGMRQWGWEKGLHIPVAAAVGLVLGGLTSYGLRRLARWSHASSGFSHKQLVGAKAEVITSIPEKGLGEIAFSAGGKRHTASARSVYDKPIPSHTTVVVERVVARVYYVRKYIEEFDGKKKGEKGAPDSEKQE